MRAMPVILDLIILLTVFALTLYYTAIGNSAPNEDTSKIVMFEVSSSALGQEPGTNLRDFVRFRAFLIEGEGSTGAGEIIRLSERSDGTQRFLVRNPTQDAEISFVATSVDLQAFQVDQWTVQVKRAFPGGEFQTVSSPVGRLPALEMSVLPE